MSAGPRSLTESDDDRRLLANVRPPDWVNPTPDGRYNLVVLGGGTAGLITAAGAAGLGAKVALVERGLLGGDCLNTGCVPSKSLLRVAHALADVRDAGRLGIVVDGASTADFAATMARLRRIRADLSSHDAATRYRSMGVDVYFGDGRFTSPDTVTVAGAELRFGRAVIATGARPATPAIPGLAEGDFLTSDTIFNLTTRPERLAVIGGGPVGCELAQAFQRLGSQVTLFEKMPRLLNDDDADAASLLADQLARDRVRLCLGATVESVEVISGGRQLRYRRAANRATLEADAILAAVGRTPNIEGLGLRAAGVSVDDDGLRIDERLRTTNRRIYAAGDVALTRRFTHLADASARIVLQNALFLGRRKLSDLVVPWVTFTDPEVAQSGLTEARAQALRQPYNVYRRELAALDRARTDGLETGFVKLLTRAGGDQILGATVVGPHAGELIAQLTIAQSNGVGLKALAEVIFPYPTLSAAVKGIADDYNRGRFTPRLQSLSRRWLRYRR